MALGPADAGGGEQADLAIDRVARAPARVDEQLGGVQPVLGEDHVRRGPATELILGASEQLAERAVDADHLAHGRDQRHPDRRRGERVQEAPLGQVTIAPTGAERPAAGAPPADEQQQHGDEDAAGQRDRAEPQPAARRGGAPNRPDAAREGEGGRRRVSVDRPGAQHVRPLELDAHGGPGCDRALNGDLRIADAEGPGDDAEDVLHQVPPARLVDGRVEHEARLVGAGEVQQRRRGRAATGDRTLDRLTPVGARVGVESDHRAGVDADRGVADREDRPARRVTNQPSSVGRERADRRADLALERGALTGQHLLQPVEPVGVAAADHRLREDVELALTDAPAGHEQAADIDHATLQALCQDLERARGLRAPRCRERPTAPHPRGRRPATSPRSPVRRRQRRATGRVGPRGSSRVHRQTLTDG